MLKQKKKVRNWIINCIENENRIIDSVNIIFCSDDYLHELNKNYLHHDTYTDIITFDYSEDKVISGDIFISIDRVRENATSYNFPFYSELHRVIIHGFLHLTGLKDKTNADKQVMRTKEDYCLSLLPNFTL